MSQSLPAVAGGLPYSGPGHEAEAMSDESADRQEPAEDRLDTDNVERERARRLAKLADLAERGIDPYPRRFDRDRTLGEIADAYGGLSAGDETDDEVRVAGRLRLIRRQGGLIFAELRDRSGSLQLFVSRKVVGDEVFDDFERLDLGDWIGAGGTVMVTRKGELSVKVESFVLLSKALRALPDKWGGLADVDTRYRQRYVDLIVNEDARRVFAIRSAAVTAIRELLVERGYIEVETPTLSTEAGGATARPFVTHHNALDIDLYVRIALELHLKRLIVAGMERVFEIGRVFRNEGLDSRHNPEFTMLEAYQAFADFHDMMELTEQLVARAAEAAIGTTKVTLRGREVDLAPPWPRVRLTELVAEHAGVEIDPAMPVEDARKVLDGLGLEYEPEWGSGRLTDEVYDKVAQHQVVEPTFVTHYPREVSPLARESADDPTVVDRFELIVDGREMVNAFSELVDPVDQRQRFEAEAEARARGDEEAGSVDEDYLRALEYGMPPTGGLGLGIDRLVMVLAGVDTIREVILFPTLRPEFPPPGSPSGTASGRDDR